MKVVKASNKQVKYACKFFHYAKRVPQRAHSYSVYNDKYEKIKKEYPKKEN